MSKKLKNMKWDPVSLDGFPISMTDKFQGFVGLEECTSYGFDRETNNCTRKKKIQKKAKKRKTLTQAEEVPQVPTKKVKLSNGFIVESCNTVTPSLNNTDNVAKQIGGINSKKNKKHKKKKKDMSNCNAPKKDDNKEISNTNAQKEVENNKKLKMKLGEDITKVVSELTPEDMLTWAEFKLPEPILKALMELNFKKPTKIQQLTLPAAIHGRRDILGAAETGSGKTLAFGLPILTGIMKLKEKADAGLDVYEIPYKKTSVKRKNEEKKPSKKDKRQNKNKEVKKKEKESSEDGYGSGDSDDGNNEEISEETSIDMKKGTKNKSGQVTKVNSNDKNQDIKLKKQKIIKKYRNNDDDFIEEFDVPIRKKQMSDEDIDSDDSDNYTHLSEMLDSDDLVDSSDDETTGNDSAVTDRSEVSDDIDTESDDAFSEDKGSDDEEVASEDSHGEDSGDESDIRQSEEENEEGIGCVKVIDNVELPGHIVTKTGKPLYALILTPTRELAIQISRHLIAVAKYTGIKIATIVGGLAPVKQERVLARGPEVVVATPGRLWELLQQGQPHLQQLDCVKFLAIDETDRMIERGHFEELQPLLERLNSDEVRCSTRQNFVFSATLTMVHELPAHMKGKKVTKRGKIINRKIEKMTPQQKIKRLVNMLGMTDPKVVDITVQNLGTSETLTESRIACSLEQKDAYLYYILKNHPGRTIVFCNSIGCVRRLAQLFSLLKCPLLPLHASMPQRQRLKNLERFRDDPHGVLVATDVAARGLDIPNVDHVIHFQVPKTAENYVHRSGRTARANKEGLTILMMEPSEAYLYAKLCKTLNKTSELPTFPVPAHALSTLKELVAVARELDALMLKKRRVVQALGWRDKLAKEMDMIIDDDELPVKDVVPSTEKALKSKKRQLESLLSRPLFPRGFSFKYPTLNDPAMFVKSEDNALQVMKKAIQSGELKKEKRKSKNAPLLKLQKALKK
ncbi:ATP-dependent RNA helicase DDX24 [Galleria mellonella]|uniref:ATP-dependent RNA helicase n=1 Tax=Galleria mellonella TaxID=7137 RepID=A0A6J3CA14_GALME|nr:ATP-dependent RNA helicase DDX24 [Galleria mellonella]